MKINLKFLFLAGFIFIVCGVLIFLKTFGIVFDVPSDDSLGIRTIPIESPYQKHQNFVKVIVPDNMNLENKYPVLYILPTSAGLWDDLIVTGIKEAAMQDIHNKYQVILVYPKFERMPWYGNHPTKQYIQQENHFVQKVVPLIDRTFPTLSKAEGRMLLGYSKSGWGAYSLLLRYPHLFSKAASWDAPLMFNDIYQWGSGLEEVFGDADNFQQYDLYHLLQEKAYMFQDKKPRFVLMGYALIKDHTESAHEFMEKLKIPHVYHLQKQSRHSWQGGWLSLAVQHLME